MSDRRDDELDLLLREIRPPPLSAGGLLRVRRAVSDRVRGGRAPEVLTLEEVADYLRIDGSDLPEVLDELPAFELAGRLRVRRARLIEWIEHRERSWTHGATARTVGRTGKGVA